MMKKQKGNGGLSEMQKFHKQKKQSGGIKAEMKKDKKSEDEDEGSV